MEASWTSKCCWQFWGHHSCTMNTMPSDQDNCASRDSDPASLLPFSCELEPHDPNVERLPKQYLGTDKTLYGDNVM
jgi:hypothetical protein